MGKLKIRETWDEIRLETFFELIEESKGTILVLAQSTSKVEIFESYRDEKELREFAGEE